MLAAVPPPNDGMLAAALPIGRSSWPSSSGRQGRGVSNRRGASSQWVGVSSPQ